MGAACSCLPSTSLNLVASEYNKILAYFSKLSDKVRSKRMSHADAHKVFLDEKREEFPLLAAMDSFQLITSPTSAQDERYIAAMKFIKTLPRNRMHNVTMNAACKFVSTTIICGRELRKRCHQPP